VQGFQEQQPDEVGLLRNGHLIALLLSNSVLVSFHVLFKIFGSTHIGFIPLHFSKDCYI
jgi:hypothetical protein